MSNPLNMLEFIDEQRRTHEKAWSRGYGLFPDVLNSHNAQVGVEIGVAFGGHSEAILKYTRVCKLYGIDRYQHIDGYEDPMNFSQPAFDILYEGTRRRLGIFDDRFELIRASSQDAANYIEGPLDFVYIDADHSYQGCLRDVKTWLPKVREGGIIGGHDYGSDAFPGVKQAVDQFFKYYLGWTLHVEDYGCWWVKKEQTRKWRRIWIPIAIAIPVIHRLRGFVAKKLSSIIRKYKRLFR